MGLDFYKRLVELQQTIWCSRDRLFPMRCRPMGFCWMTSGVKFLAEYKFLCGHQPGRSERIITIIYRKDRAGKGTFDRVMAGIEACRRNKAEYNILVLLNNINVQHPDELFDFFTGLGIEYIQFVPCVEKSVDDPHERRPVQYYARSSMANSCAAFLTAGWTTASVN